MATSNQIGERRHQRYSFDVPISIVRPSGLPIPAIGTEISRGGMSAICPEELRIGEELNLIVPLREAGQVRLQALVRDKNDLRYGFEFVGIDDAHRRHVENACRFLSVYSSGYGY